MHTTRSHPVMMPNGEQGQQTGGKRAMDGHRRPEHALPVFHRTTRPHRVIPGHQHISGLCGHLGKVST
jgi:hypothetical protein